LASTSPPSLIDLQDLQLDDVRALLGHAGHASDQESGEPSLAYLQRLINGLCELSLKDPLTGLGNRRHFIATLERAIEVVARSGESILLLLLDIDHFKHINDTHGHLAGDQVLQAVAACLSHCIRPMDAVARYGGEEFAMILPNCRPNCGRAVAERVRHLIESLSIPVTPLANLHITVSIGGAYAPEWVRSTTDLWIERADQQLYRAKADGRNRVFLDLPHEISVSAEEKSLLFSHFILDQAATTSDDAPADDDGTTGNVSHRVNA
jgi:diguanylate cyclase (GGDEF)-like protein